MNDTIPSDRPVGTLPVRRMLGWIGFVVLLALGLWLLNLTAYHLWASSGPPTPNPGWHRAWGWCFLAMSGACVASGTFLLWLSHRRRVA